MTHQLIPLFVLKGALSLLGPKMLSGCSALTLAKDALHCDPAEGRGERIKSLIRWDALGDGMGMKVTPHGPAIPA
jgi:hypothetical protein